MDYSTPDLSNHDWDTFDPACFYRQGVRRAILGCWDLDKTRSMTRDLRAAGIVVEDLYTFLYYGLPTERREVSNALAVHQELGGISRVWLDCEAHFTEQAGDFDTEAPGMTPAIRIAKTMEARNTVRARGLSTGIYTGTYWWRDNMADTTAFKDDPLWIANYGRNDGKMAPLTELGVLAFGGWTRASVHQYTSTGGYCGRPNRDLNYWNLEDTMASAEYNELKGMLLAINERLDAVELGFGSGAEEQRTQSGTAISRAEKLTNARYRVKGIGDSKETADPLKRSLLQQAANIHARLAAIESRTGLGNAVQYGDKIDLDSGRIIKDA